MENTDGIYARLLRSSKGEYLLLRYIHDPCLQNLIPIINARRLVRPDISADEILEDHVEGLIRARITQEEIQAILNKKGEA